LSVCIVRLRPLPDYGVVEETGCQIYLTRLSAAFGPPGYLLQPEFIDTPSAREYRHRTSFRTWKVDLGCPHCSSQKLTLLLLLDWERSGTSAARGLRSIFPHTITSFVPTLKSEGRVIGFCYPLDTRVVIIHNVSCHHDESWTATASPQAGPWYAASATSATAGPMRRR